MKHKKALWGLSIFLLLASFGAFSSSFISGLLVLLTAMGCNPLFLAKLEQQGKRPSNKILAPLLTVLFLVGVALSPSNNNINIKQTIEPEQIQEVEKAKADNVTTSNNVQVEKEEKEAEQNVTAEETTTTQNDSTQTEEQTNTANIKEYNGVTYTIIEVDGGDLSGNRQANVAVNIGFGDREYWAYTNEYGQLIYVVADKIILQDDSTEPVNSKGRYYNDEAKVPGTEQKDLDEGHVIADSLGGVSNAYNITPQNSTLNRHGDQAYMEKVIRDAGGCENFVATITYPDTTTQIPSHYNYVYILKGETIVDDFDNVNPDEFNARNDTKSSDSSSSAAATSNSAVASNSTTNQDTEVVEQVEEIAASTDETSVEVHITKTGKKYHSAGCQYLSKSDIITTLDKAKAKGLGPCSKCSPPQ